MKNLLFAIFLAYISLTGAFGQPSSISSTSARADKEILFLERQRFDSMIKKDSTVLKNILADDLQYTHSNGKTDNNATFLNNIFSGRTVYRSIQTESVQVRDYGNTALVTGLAKVNLITEGKEMDLRLHYIDVYIKKNGRWQMVAWQSTKVIPPDNTK